MPSTATIAVLIRRWYVVVAGLAATAGMIASIHVDPGVYSTQADVVFLAPRSIAHPNPMGSTSASLIATAGLVSRIVDDGTAKAPMASSGVALTSVGVRRGSSVRLPNSGGQWSDSFSRPVLDVQVVGSSALDVRAGLARQIDRINAALLSMQASDGIGPENFIITSSAPDLATVEHAAGDPRRAMAAALLLGATTTVLASLLLDGPLVARSSRRRRRSLTPPLPLSRMETT